MPIYAGKWDNDDAGDEYMGAPRSYDGPRVDLTPSESHCDGCPGGWYRSGFVQSLSKYERLIFDGGFSSNLLLDRCTDPLVIEAAQYIEIERLRHRNYWNGKRFD